MKPHRRAMLLLFIVWARVVKAVIPHVSDRTLARVLRTAERVAYVLTGDRDLQASIGEVAEVFELGPPYSATTRQIAASLEKDAGLALSALICLKRPSPYNAD